MPVPILQVYENTILMYADQALLEYYPAPFTPLTNPPRCPVMEMTIAVTTCTPYRTRTHCELDLWYKATTDHISKLASPPNIKCSNRLPFGAHLPIGIAKQEVPLRRPESMQSQPPVGCNRTPKSTPRSFSTFPALQKPRKSGKVQSGSEPAQRVARASQRVPSEDQMGFPS